MDNLHRLLLDGRLAMPGPVGLRDDARTPQARQPRCAGAVVP
ncbi:hypothetical protein [Streptomyces sp. NPDC021969]